MAWDRVQILNLTAPTAANTNGTANSFQNGKAVDKIRWWLTTAGATDGNHALQVSPDNSVWANVAAANADLGTGTITNTAEGPIAYVRIVTAAGATQGTGSAKVAGILKG